MPRPPAPHGTENRWRAGCHRCEPCRAAHNIGTREHRRRVVDRDLFPESTRARLLELLTAGVHLTDATTALGVSQQAVHGYARVHPEWGRLLDQALMDGRDPEVPHGTPSGYRYWWCRCPECRGAHHPSRLDKPGLD